MNTILQSTDNSTNETAPLLPACLRLTSCGLARQWKFLVPVTSETRQIEQQHEIRERVQYLVCLLTL